MIECGVCHGARFQLELGFVILIKSISKSIPNNPNAGNKIRSPTPADLFNSNGLKS